MTIEEHIVDEKGVDHVLFDKNQGYQVTFNEEDPDPNGLKTTLIDALRLLDDVMFYHPDDGDIKIYAIVVDQDQEQVEFRIEEHGCYTCEMFQRISINRTTGQAKVQSLEEGGRVFSLVFKSDLITMVDI